MEEYKEESSMIKTIDGIIEAARGGEPGIIAVAAAHDRPVIEAVAEARREGIAVPGGPRGRDRRHAQGAGGGPRRL